MIETVNDESRKFSSLQTADACLGKMSIYVDKMSGYELADAVRKSLDAYNSCMAGDSFSPHGVWDGILADMKSKADKG